MPICELDISGFSQGELIAFLREMIKIRTVEQLLAQGRKSHLIGGPVHLGVGQEAIAVGISSVLSDADYVFGAHRSHAHLLALGANLQSFFSEILGKISGLSGGMGGSMHLIDESVGFMGSVPIVAGTVPLAVGAAIAAKMKGENGIGVVYLGDGAMEEGVVHESLNLAKITNAPILFVVENNFYASHMHINLRQPKDTVVRFAKAHCIPCQLVDGNDLISVSNTAKEMVARVRAGEGPAFIEAITYRWLGHVDWCDDIDVGVDRSIDTLNLWKKRDPIDRLLSAMLNQKFITKERFEELSIDILASVNDAWERAKLEANHTPKNLMKHVYVGD